ncbi:S-adenosyl-L-methionine-dependent methyltransferase [Ramicandelaber brevisporus]|nr:S-adenosyl-L-methionine-dependent methyltransferase [Ramicandelaber brevisporus]
MNVTKLIVKNLPKYTTVKDVKKVFADVPLLKDLAVKVPPRLGYALVTLKSKDQLDEAQTVVSALTVKGNALTASLYEPVMRPSKKARVDRSTDEQAAPAVVDTRPAAERLADQVTALHAMPYEEQLVTKRKTMLKVIDSFKREINKLYRNKGDGKAPPAAPHANQLLGETVASPQIDGYRTKNEFTIGLDSEKQLTVGFQLGLFRDGITEIASADETRHTPQSAKSIAKHMQELARGMSYSAYSKSTHSGFWRGLLARTPSTGEVMVAVQYNPHGMDDAQLDEVDAKILEHFTSDAAREKGINLTTLLVQRHDGMAGGFTDKVPLKVLHGDGIVHEQILGYKFRLSPMAFFQVNQPATEVLYTIARKWALDTNAAAVKPILLDVCCGTGTIGITMSEHVSKVVGIEIVQSAVDDARTNANANNVANTEYICSKAEDAIKGVIRQCEKIQSFVYIACNADAAKQNFIELCKPESKKYAGKPFILEKAVPVDLFPHTPHCELVLRFIRSN